jgi:molybdopterin/thiamine biosynthesis adenylyltransferase
MTDNEPSRQSFLGADSASIFAACKIGVIGVSGGGSHIVQQAAHVGFLNYAVIDPKTMEEKHLHRIVGATAHDVEVSTPKAKIAERLIKGIRPKANVDAIVDQWQNAQRSLRDSTAIVGCVDSYSEREQIERFCRRFLIPYIDIGMDVLRFDNDYRIIGQIVMSSPGQPCLRCMAVVTEEKLKEEAARYGEAGPKAQVIWPNAILASSAIGLLVQLLTPWHRFGSSLAYLEYNGNTPTLVPSPRLEHAVQINCPHYAEMNLGDPFFDLEKLGAP